jgi:hypothetical protein
VAGWIKATLAVGVAILFASLFVLPWVDSDDGQLSDVRAWAEDASEVDGAPEEVDRLAGYTAWMPWTMAVACAATGAAAVLSSKRMRTGTRIALVVVVVQFIALPAGVMIMMGSAATTVEGTQVQDDSGANLVGLVVVVGLALAVLVGLSFVPAHLIAAGAAVIGCIGQFVAMSDLSELEVDTELGVPALFLGYIAVAVAAVAARRSQPPPLAAQPQMAAYPQGAYGSYGAHGPYGPGPR